MFESLTRRMKAVFAVTIVASMSCIGLALYWHYLFVFYPEHAVTAFMLSKEHQTTAKRHSDYDWYIEVAIPSSQGESLLRQHQFRSGYDPHAVLPKIPSPEIGACTACWSYYEGNSHGVYGYFLAVLSSDKKSLQLYEFFGN